MSRYIGSLMMAKVMEMDLALILVEMEMEMDLGLMLVETEMEMDMEIELTRLKPLLAQIDGILRRLASLPTQGHY